MNSAQRNTGILVGVTAAVAGVAVAIYMLHNRRAGSAETGAETSVSELLERCQDKMHALQTDVERLGAAG